MISAFWLIGKQLASQIERNEANGRLVVRLTENHVRDLRGDAVNNITDDSPEKRREMIISHCGGITQLASWWRSPLCNWAELSGIERTCHRRWRDRDGSSRKRSISFAWSPILRSYTIIVLARADRSRARCANAVSMQSLWFVGGQVQEDEERPIRDKAFQKTCLLTNRKQQQ